MAGRLVSIANHHSRLQLDRREVMRLIHGLDAAHREIAPPPFDVPSGELSLVFLTDPALAQLHAQFLADPSPTDVITFEGDPAHATAGEICVSVDTAAAYAAKHRREFHEELTLYVVHGWLHLAGYDDLQPAKKRAMRRAEARAMEHLMAVGAIPAFTLKPSRRARA